MAEFKFNRGIRNEDFMGALAKLATQKSWWRDVLHDPSLIIAVRNEYLNVYWQGQSIFTVSLTKGEVIATTHPKYLLDPSLSGQVTLSGSQFGLAEFKLNMLINDYTPGVTLPLLKRAANVYSGAEKQGVHNIVRANDSVIDVEIAFGGESRLDLALFESDPNGKGVDLVFWEAKLLGNKELYNGSISNQIEKYRNAIKKHEGEILKSYRCVASNLVGIANMSEDPRPVGDEVKRIAEQPADLKLSEEPIGLVIYEYDEHQRSGLAKPLEEQLGRELKLDKKRLRFKGDTSKMALKRSAAGANPRPAQASEPTPI